MARQRAKQPKVKRPEVKRLRTAAERLILSSQRPSVLCHVEPDGDAIGSGLAMAMGLLQLGKPAWLVSPDGLPPHLAYLPQADALCHSELPQPPPDLLVCLDTGSLDRFGRAYDDDRDLFSSTPILNVDHHATNTYFGTVNLVDPEAPAVAEVVYELLVNLGVLIDSSIATCLVAAVLADTQRLRTPSTRPKTLRLVASLQEAGASLSDLMRKSEKALPKGQARLWGRLLSSVCSENGVSWVSLSRREAHEINGTAELWNGLAELLFQLEGASVVAILREVDGNAVKVSLRSRGETNVAQTALALGGGGHPGAAGCTISGSLAEAERAVLSRLRQQLASGSSGQGLD